MKKQVIRLISLTMALLMTTAITSCNKGTTETESIVTYEKVKLENNTQVDADTAEVTLQKELKGKGGNITMLSQWPIDSVQGQCWQQQYKALTGGNIDKIIVVGYSDMQKKLASLHQSGQDPDIYQVTNQDFPSIMFKNILMPLDDKIDFSNVVWSDKKNYIDSLRWNGNCYFSPKIVTERSIWWNRSLFEQAGISPDEMPDALVEANKWTWDTFYELEKRVANVEKGIYGFNNGVNLCYAFTASTGEDYVKIGESGFESNVKSANITRAMNMMKKVLDPSYAAPQSLSATELFKRGKLAMTYYHHMTDNKILGQMLNDGTIEYTHFPRDPKQSEYIYMGCITGFAIPVGAKNVDAAVAFIKMFEASSYYQEQVDQINYKNANFNEETMKFVIERESSKMVPCYSLGIKEIQQMVWNATGATLHQGSTTWESIAASLEPQMNKELNKLG